jgi:hypothetical protein
MTTNINKSLLFFTSANKKKKFIHIKLPLETQYYEFEIYGNKLTKISGNTTITEIPQDNHVHTALAKDDEIYFIKIKFKLFDCTLLYISTKFYTPTFISTTEEHSDNINIVINKLDKPIQQSKQKSSHNNMTELNLQLSDDESSNCSDIDVGTHFWDIDKKIL